MYEIPSRELARCATIALFERYEGSAELTQSYHLSRLHGQTDSQGREIVLSTPTETDFLDENVQTVEDQVDTTTPVTPETTQDQQEHKHYHHHDHTHEDGELSPMCVGGGCVTKTTV